jgi:drug/metabolite transporter (DMT)-like permease
MLSIDRFFTLIFLLIPITWSGSFIAGKYVIQDVDPISSVLIRFTLSGMLMLPWLTALHRKKHPDFKDKQYLFHLILVILTAGIGYHLFFFWALKHTSPTNTAIIIALNPFFTALAERVIFKQKRSQRFYIGFMIAFTGALWVNIARGGSLDLSNLGIGELLCLMAALLWSAYAILAKLTRKDHFDSLWTNAYNYLFTGLLLIPFAPHLFSSEFWSGIGIPAWTGLLYMVIFPTTIGYTMFYIGVIRKGPAWASTFIYMVPSITANLDYLFFKVTLTTSMVAGTTMVVFGLLIGNLGKKQLEWMLKKTGMR